MQAPTAAAAGTTRRPLGIRPRSLPERVGVDLDDGAEERVEAGDAVQVVPDERRGCQAAVAEALADGVEGGLLDLEAAAAGGDGEKEHGGG